MKPTAPNHPPAACFLTGNPRPSTGRAIRCLAAILLTGHLLAASTAEPTPAKPGKPDPPPAKPAAPALAKIKPSRLVGEKELDAYVEDVSAIFSMRDRAFDPFGQPQDPNAKPVVKPTTTKTLRRVVQVQATPFSDIVRLIKVTTVMPKDKCFLMGSRTIKQGDIVNLAYHGKNLRVEVATVNSQQIDFRNLDNNESASLKLNVLPTGMSRGTGSISAPGMTPDRPDLPIDLDPSYSPLNDKNPPR